MKNKIVIISAIILGICGQSRAAELYHSNFDNIVPGTLPSGWTNVGTADFKIGRLTPISGGRSVYDANGGDNNIVLYTGVPSRTSMAAQFSQVMQLNGQIANSLMGMILQSDVSAQNYYEVVLYPPLNRIYFYKTSGGVRTQLNEPIKYNFYDGSGEYVTLKADVNNGIITIKLWPPGGKEPDDSLATSTTDLSPLTNAGYAGVRTVIAGGLPAPMFDDFYMGESGTHFVMDNIRPETECWSDRTAILEPSGAADWEQYILIEPTTPIWDGSQWVMFYTGHNRTNGRIGRATSPDLINWTKYAGNPVLGGGAGGESGDANEPQSVFKDGIWYLFYSNGYGSTADGRVATSADGITFSNPQTFVAHDSQSWMDGVANKGIIIEDGVWKMLMEANLTNVTRYEVGLATSSDGINWNLYSGNSLSSMQINDGIWAGARSIIKEGNYYHTWYQASFDNLFPNNIAHAYSTDLIHWAVKGNYPVFFREMESFPLGFADQVADPIIMENNGKTYMFYDVDRNEGNAGQDAYTAMATCNMTLSQLLADTESDSLVGHWDMDATSISSPALADASGWGGTGIIFGSPAEMTGHIAEALSFNGTDQYIEIGDVHSVGLRDKMTVSAWIKPDSFPAVGDFSYILGKGIDGAFLNESYYLRFSNGSGTVNLDFGSYINASVHDANWQSTLTIDNAWHLVTGTYDSSAYNIYVDGDLVATSPDLNPPVDTTHPLLIGAADIGGTPARFFDGGIDDVRIYNRALSATEIGDIFDPPPPPPDPEPTPEPQPAPVPASDTRMSSGGNIQRRILNVLSSSPNLASPSPSSGNRTILSSSASVTTISSSSTPLTHNKVQLPDSSKFSTSFGYGTLGDFARNLQILLNDLGFDVASVGPGSKGNETSYFGPATKAALIRFQEYYLSDILIPAGLNKGTGFVGPFTIRKLNSLIGE